jgi:hypothetical protein
MSITAHVINVADRTDRWERFMNDWQDQTTLKIEREDAFKPDGVIRNIYDAVFLKHREILTKAHERGDKFCLIMEDDAKPCKDFAERLEAILEYLEIARDEWEIFNGGMLSIRDSIQGIIRLTHKLTNLFPPTMLLNVNRGSMAHFLIFHVDRAMKKIGEWEADGKPEFDAWYSHKLRCVACVPYLAEQHDGYSDANGEQREWSDRFRFEESTMLYSLREFIYHPSSLSSPTDASGSLLLEEK